MAVCRSCGAEIVWIETKAGHQTPCDPDLLTIVTEWGVVTRGRTCHFATCPDGETWRNRKPKAID